LRTTVKNSLKNLTQSRNGANSQNPKSRRVPLRKKKLFIQPPTLAERLFKNGDNILDIKVERIKKKHKESLHSINSFRDSRLSPRNPAFDEFHQDYIHAREQGRAQPSPGFAANPFLTNKSKFEFK